MKYIKKFDEWNNNKKNINNANNRVSFFEGEIWWCYLGVNIGSEQDGRGNIFVRPVLIYKKISSKLFIAIPITKNLDILNNNLVFYFNYNIYSMLIFQIRIIDSLRLVNKIDNISNYIHKKTKKAVATFLG